MVIQTGTIAAVAVAFAKFTGVVFPWIGERHVLLSVPGLTITTAQLLAILSITVLTFINTLGLREGKAVQDVFTIVKTLALLGLIALTIFIGRNAAAISSNWSVFWQGTWTRLSGEGIPTTEPLSGIGLLAAIGVAMVGSLFASDAWNNITFTAGEVVNPRRIIPRSMVLGTATVILLYLLANLGYVLVLPIRGAPDATDVLSRGIQFAAYDRVGTAAASVIFGDTAAIIMAILIMVSTFGCNNGLILAGARVYYAMAQDRLFFRKAGTLNNNAVPGIALWVQCLWASILCISGTYSDLLDYVIFAVLLFYILTVLGIFILRKKLPNAERPYRAVGYPLVPALYVFIAAAICLDLLILKPKYTWPGMLIVLAGIPLYFLWRKFSGPTDGA